MKTSSMIMALVVVLGFCRQVGAVSDVPDNDYTVEVSGHRYGIIDDVLYGLSQKYYQGTYIYLGPLDTHQVPFTATQGLIGFCCILAMLIVLTVVVLTVRWKKKGIAA